MTARDPHSASEEPVPFSFSSKSFHTALRLAQVMAIGTVGLGALVLVGWLFDIQAFKSILPGFVSMKANTALCFALCGTALLVGYLSRPSAWKKNWTTVLSSIVISISLLSICETITGFSLGLDQLIFRDNTVTLGTSPGRMAPATAGGFLLFGASLIFLARGPKGALTAHVLALAGLFIAMLALVGYLFDAKVTGSLTRLPKSRSIPSWASGCSASPFFARAPRRASWPRSLPTAPLDSSRAA